MILGLLAYVRGYGWKSSVDGRFVARAYAEANPRETYRVTFWRRPR